MIQQLILSKRLFTEGSEFAEKSDPISAGMAISLFQDSVEMLCWTAIKELDIKVTGKETFPVYLDKIEKSEKMDGHKLPLKGKILELNKARVSFKHYGILPDKTEAIKYRTYSEAFLEEACTQLFDINFKELSLIEMVPFQDVKAALKEADNFLKKDDVANCNSEIAKAKKLLFDKLSILVPKIDGNLSQADALFTDARGYRVKAKPFNYITKYLSTYRDLYLVLLCGIPLQDYYKAVDQLPSVTKFGSGRWQTHHNRSKYDKDIPKKSINMFISMSIKISKMIEGQ